MSNRGECVNVKSFGTAEPPGSAAETLGLFDLQGRCAIVTGGAGFLGQVFARALVDLGATVHLFDWDDEAVTLAAKRLEGLPGQAIAVACDITDEHAVAEAVDAVADNADLDVLVNSAALNPKAGDGRHARSLDTRGFTDYPLEAWRRSLEVNLTGTFLATRSVCRHMEQQADGRGRGVVVNISSTYGLTGPDQRIYERTSGARAFKPVDYPVTKAGVLGFTRAVAAYYRGTGIRVNALTPGGAIDDHDPEFVAAYSARTIIGRMADPAEYRGAIAFLCSDASSYMTGANLILDGGWTAL